MSRARRKLDQVELEIGWAVDAKECLTLAEPPISVNTLNSFLRGGEEFEEGTRSVLSLLTGEDPWV